MKTKRMFILAVCAVGTMAATLVQADDVMTKEMSKDATPVAAAAPAAPAEPAKSWSVDAGADYFSQYIFRGVDLLNHNPVAEPHVYFKWNNFGVYYTGYYGDPSAVGHNFYEEQDISGDYTLNFLKDQLSLTAGAYGYTYTSKKDGLNTVELYGALAWNWAVLNPKLLINWDVDQYHGGYGQACISHAFDLSKSLGLKDPLALTITPSAALGIDFGYNSKATQSNVNWNDVLLGLVANLQINEYLAIHAGVQGSLALNSLHDINQRNAAIANFGFNVVF